MLYMVIESFKSGDPVPVYRRFRDQGRMMPDGLRYVSSWVETSYGRCFQLMECDDPRLFEEWFSHWSDLVDFEFIPVVPSADAAREILARL